MPELELVLLDEEEVELELELDEEEDEEELFPPDWDCTALLLDELLLPPEKSRPRPDWLPRN